MERKLIITLTFIIGAAVLSQAQPYLIAEGQFLEQGCIERSFSSPVFQFEDSLYAMITLQQTGNLTCFSADLHDPNTWIDNFDLTYHGHYYYNPYDIFVSNSGQKYVWDFDRDLLFIVRGWYTLDSLPCPGKPLVDAEEDFHVIWGSYLGPFYYGISNDTLLSFNHVDTLNFDWDFITLTSSPDNSLVAAIFYADSSLYKFRGDAGQPIDFSSPEIIPCEPSPVFCFDITLDHQGNVYFIYSAPGRPGSWGEHYIWSERYGSRYLDESMDDANNCPTYQIAFGPDDNEMMIICARDQYDYFITFDYGDSWLRSRVLPIDVETWYVTRQYADTVRFFYNHSEPGHNQVLYHPISREYLIDNLTSISDDNTATLPINIQLSCYPNPFNAQTTISYKLTQQTAVTLEIYDILGRKVQTLVDKVQQSGSYDIAWDASGVSSGIYFARLQAGEIDKLSKMILLK